MVARPSGSSGWTTCLVSSSEAGARRPCGVVSRRFTKGRGCGAGGDAVRHRSHHIQHQFTPRGGWRAALLVDPYSVADIVTALHMIDREESVRVFRASRSEQAKKFSEEILRAAWRLVSGDARMTWAATGQHGNQTPLL
jgi:hypothetical protein